MYLQSEKWEDIKDVHWNLKYQYFFIIVKNNVLLFV